MSDIAFMRHALSLAAQGLGRTWPNPTVGCVIVKNGQVLAAARTADGGRPHAETQALSGIDAKGATAYVTLEPCAHVSLTPACAFELAKAGISRVVIACPDPDSRTAGKGVDILKSAGIEVVENVCLEEAQALNAGFFRRVETGLPLLAIKTATSLDGFIADAEGRSQWITGEAARHHGHMLRAQHDAIITGIGTVLADDPALTCRVKGLEKYSPVRVVFDNGLRLSLESQLVKTAQHIPVWVVTSSEDKAKIAKLEKLGVVVKHLPAHDGHVDAEATLRWLASEGITRALAEGGAALNTHLLPYAQRIYWFRAPILLGGGKSAFEGTQPSHAPSDLPRFAKEATLALGKDTLEIYGI
ncbi:MAG: bifunctional diaminohydroxyphosphoribosylaminopyrimidine deaminase/5-amino-6-(5-phosphoribosylamino)uracil reductase RibD [Alphaproteobacteria bacterium]|nr:bifunctional diaminohydroxyphosphoribosylaminopyrimidine deaminase/5-amino-6-(5-phosphoribosylamino)uracil reductase RibD [Alphaproteobacteria bacterium]